MPENQPGSAEKDVPTQRHDPTNLSSRQGCWVTCSCGWRSATWMTVGAAHANFGRHLVSVLSPAKTKESQ